MNSLIMIGVFLGMLSTLLNAADRPTAEQVKKAVEVSHVKYQDEHPTHDFVRDLCKQLDKLKKVRGKALKEADAEERKELLLQYTADIDSLTVRMQNAKRKLKEVSKDDNYLVYPRDVDENALKELGLTVMNNTRLSRLDWGKLNVGVVGWVGLEKSRDNLSENGQMRCIQKLPDGTWIGERVIRHERYALNPTPGPQGPIRTEEETQGVVMIKGVSSDLAGKTIQDGGDFSIAFNAIVVGEYTYETTTGASKTIFVLEKFDPNVPFQ